jgi:carbamoyl-phosphate synthase large subunit
MASTGEVAAFGTDLREAYWTSLTSTNGFRVPQANSGVLIGGDIACPQMATVAKGLSDLGFKLYCTSSVVEEFLNSLPYVSHAEKIFFPVKDKRKLREVFDEVRLSFPSSFFRLFLQTNTLLVSPHSQFDIQSVINLAKSRGRDVLDEDYVARRNAVYVPLPFISSLEQLAHVPSPPRKKGISGSRS